MLPSDTALEWIRKICKIFLLHHPVFAPPPPPAPAAQGQQAQANLAPPALTDNHDDQPGNGQMDGGENRGLNGMVAQAIPVPQVQAERHPYHALARENAEALNVLLTRDVPILTNQMQQNIQLLDTLIRRQLDNQV